MEPVKELVRRAMPSISNDLMESLMARLELVGVNGLDDLTFVKTEDVDGILPPIQCRRLIQAFSAGKFLHFYISKYFNIILLFINIFWHDYKFLV